MIDGSLLLLFFHDSSGPPAFRAEEINFSLDANTQPEFNLEIQTEIEQILSINRQVDDTLEINRSMEFTVER